MEAVEDYEKSKIPIKGVAEEMLRASEREHYIKHLDKIPDDARLIVFNSINYETEIMQLQSGNVVVLTCNNEQNSWDTALDRIEERFSRSYRYIEESEDYDSLIYEHPCYGDSHSETFYDLDDQYEVYFTFDVPKFAKEYGPVAYINENGVVLYKNEDRIVLK